MPLVGERTDKRTHPPSLKLFPKPLDDLLHRLDDEKDGEDDEKTDPAVGK
jgi:hypothetical protein